MTWYAQQMRAGYGGQEEIKSYVQCFQSSRRMNVILSITLSVKVGEETQPPVLGLDLSNLKRT